MPMVTVPQALALALQHYQAGRWADAETLYRQILAAQPGHADALHHLGLVAQQTGRHESAVEWIRQAIALDPHHPAPHANLGEIYRTVGRLEEAIACFCRALEIKSDFLQAHNNLGLALTAVGRFGEAEAAFRRVLQIDPQYAIAHYNLGLALARQNRFDEAITAFRRALELRPDYVEAHSNLGAALAVQGKFDEAMDSYHRALALRPDDPDAHNNQGAALAELGQFAEAIAAYRRSLRSQPAGKGAQFNLALQLLLRGDFAEGWPLFEARWEALHYARRDFSQPRWDGSFLDGRRVFIHAEQGFGDSIQFIRYARLIADRGGQVIVGCQPPLQALFRGAPGVSEVLAFGDALPPFDLHVPMLSLPLVFQTTPENIPRVVPYLFADPARRETWRGRMGGPSSRFRVGLVWAGNSTLSRDRIRSLPAHYLLPLLAIDGVDFFSVQKEGGRAQIQNLPGAERIIDHTAHLHDFADTAAFVKELDLVISVDTAVAHLGGALGCPVWTLLPFVPDWRWGLETEQAPWYPTMRLFRQPAAGDWESVIRRVREELSRIVTGRGSLLEL